MSYLGIVKLASTQRMAVVYAMLQPCAVNESKKQPSISFNLEKLGEE